MCLIAVGCGGETGERGEARGEGGEERAESREQRQEVERETKNDERKTVPYYRFLTGRISDELDIAMQLHVRSDSVISGYYWYQNVGRPIELTIHKETSGPEKVFLVEKDPDMPFDESISGMFEGDFYYRGLIEGIWSNGDRSINFPFLLNDAHPEGAAEISLHDFEYKAQDCDDPADCLGIHITELRVGGIAEEVEKKINSELAEDYARFIHSNPDQPLITNLQEAIDSLENWMERERAEKDKDYLNNWEFHAMPSVLYNQDDKLSIRIDYYSYSGGAHGNPFTLCYNYDLKTGKKLALADLFQPSQVPKLKEEALRRIKLTYEGTANDDLSDLGFLISDEEFELGKDFFYSSAGVGIIYSPYEIGPYAMGFVEVFVPFSRLGK